MKHAMISDMRQICGQNESLCSRLQEFSPPCFHKLGLRQCSASLMTIYNHLSPVKVKHVNMITLSWWWRYRRPLSHWTGSSSVDVKLLWLAELRYLIWMYVQIQVETELTTHLTVLSPGECFSRKRWFWIHNLLQLSCQSPGCWPG